MPRWSTADVTGDHRRQTVAMAAMDPRGASPFIKALNEGHAGFARFGVGVAR
ncbi:hypothetical protein SynA1560_01577 [Synechococcus sp. A15-60]|nr:hypothetical protein SynA1560_01577 [Synechococcus sp. A15-60]